VTTGAGQELSVSAMNQYLMVYPVYVVNDVKSDGSGVEPLTAGRADGTRAITVFTEPLLAERCRNSWRKEARINELATPEEFCRYLSAAQSVGLNWVVFDAHAEVGKRASFVPIADILTVQGNNLDS